VFARVQPMMPPPAVAGREDRFASDVGKIFLKRAAHDLMHAVLGIAL
jgi:hypothetical protein